MEKAIENRYEFVLYFDVENGNPNGDPDAGNMPRIDPETGYGLVTDVCVKRKVRNYVDLVKEGAEGFNIYVTEGAVLNDQHLKAYRSQELKPEAKKLPKDEEKAAAVTAFMCANFYDIRTFGAVMTTEVNCGQVRGPVQFGFARSVDPIVQQEITITRVAVTKAADAQNKEHEMGRKHIVSYGLYRMEGFISAPLAEKTGFDNDDLKLLWDALLNMFDHDRSAARGLMATRKLIVFRHESKLGNAPASALFGRVTASRKAQDRPARAFSDYAVSVDTQGLPEGVQVLELL
jgi:CRISPR-associated protein Csd2